MLRRAGLLVLITLAAAACDEHGPEAALADYRERLGRPLEVATETPSPAVIPLLPERSSLRLELSSGNLGTLDFLALSGCAVQITIGKRNSSLGLMASASQRLLLELEYLQLAPACIAHMRTKDRGELAEILEQAWQLKRRQLPALIFNATLGGTEFRQFWQPAANLAAYPTDTSSLVITALYSIAGKASRWLDGDYRADNLAFELDLSEIAKGDGGRLLQALALQQAWLDSADNAIAERLGKGPLCRPGIRPAAADIVTNVVRKYFIDGIQPWSAQLGQRQHQLLPAIQQLEQLTRSAHPASFQRWREHRDQLVQQWTAAPRQHVHAVQQLLESCDD